jgi:heme exporter protein C
MSWSSTVPKKISTQILRWNILLSLFAVFQLYGWYLAIFKIGADTDQGNVYRIIFIHVPIAWCAFFWFFFGAFFGLLGLLVPKKSTLFDRSSHAAMELGVLFSFLVLVTGSLWGKPTWGVWWDWDPRLTSSLVLFLMGCGYLLLRYFTLNLQSKRRLSAIVSLLGAFNVPIVYFSVNLWRSLHQPQTFIQKTQNASGDIKYVLLLNLIALFLLSIAIYKIRRQSISAQESLAQVRSQS